MKKSLLIVGLFILFTIQSIAQNKGIEMGTGIKLYNDKPILLLNTSYAKNLEKNYFQKINFFAGIWREERIEMDEMFQRIIVAGQRLIDTEVGIGLQGNWKLKETDRFLLYGGWMTNLSYDHSSFIPLTSASFPERINRGELEIGSVIGLNKKWKSDFYWNIELPIYFMEFGFERLNVENPVMPFGERRTNTLFFDLQPRVMGKIGLGVIL